MYVYFQENELELTNHLWLVVQWGDAAGNWHNVEGWQGAPDAIEKTEDSLKVTKRWWVVPEYTGRGPFRWLVLHRETGAHIAVSEPFYLPGHGNLSVAMEIIVAAEGVVTPLLPSSGYDGK